MVDGLTRDSRKQFVFMSLNIFRFLLLIFAAGVVFFPYQKKLQKVAEAAAVIVAAKAVAANIAHSTGTSIVGECCCITNQIRPVSQ